MSELKKPKITQKTRNIIISVVCITILLAGIITSIVLATRKIFKIEFDNEINYNTHTSMKMLEFDRSAIKPVSADEVYNNGTIIVEENGTNLRGIYSLEEDRLVIDTIHPQDNGNIFGITVENDFENETLFRITNENGTFSIVNDKGKNTNLTSIEDHKLYAYKMSKEITTSAKKESVRVKISKKFVKEKIEISNVEFIEDYRGDNYNYEIWKITTSDGVVYQNIYEVKEGSRELIQTLGLTEGIGFTTPNNFHFFVSTEGKPLIQEMYEINRKESNGVDNILMAYKYTLYDINYNILNTLEIDSELINKSINDVHIGDFSYFQTLENGTEKKHTFYDTNPTTLETIYFNLKTFKINYVKGTFEEIDFDFIIEDSYGKQEYSFPTASSNESISTIATLSVREIEKKKLLPAKLVLVNEKLQTKDIDFVCTDMTKLSDNRFIAIDADNNHYLVDKNYNLIKRFGQIESYFTTSDSILVNINSTTYVCNYDGSIIKKYNSDKITNIHNDRFYLVKELVMENSVEKSKYYLEQCGHRNENYIYETYIGMTTYTYGDETYNKLIVSDGNSNSDINSDELSILVRIKEVNSTNYTYEFYNYENELLLRANNIPTSNVTIDTVYSDNDSTIIYCDYNVTINDVQAGRYFSLDR